MSIIPEQGRFKYEKLTKYPHLKPEDIAVWEEFIDQHPNAYTTVNYDVGVGRVEKAREMAKELDLEGEEKLYQYKIDIVGYGNTEIHIIELKPKATPSAIGQVITYKRLFDEDTERKFITTPVIIVKEANEEIEKVMIDQSIKLIVLRKM